ncbi:MAG: hypothetical protein ACI92G_003921 [Candidatus Pelagisphaera sp.]
MDGDFGNEQGIEGWRFSSQETCREYWEVSGVGPKGRRVLRTGTMSPEILLEECIADAQELDRKTPLDQEGTDNGSNQTG